MKIKANVQSVTCGEGLKFKNLKSMDGDARGGLIFSFAVNPADSLLLLLETVVKSV